MVQDLVLATVNIMNADVRIDAVVMSAARLINEPFRPTITYNQDFHWNTTLNTYETSAVLASAELALLNYVANEIDRGATTTLHIQVWLDNITHVPTAKGVVRLPKGAHDFTWSQGDLEGIALGEIKAALANVITNMRNSAKY